jgi:hypothetical protein
MSPDSELNKMSASNTPPQRASASDRQADPSGYLPGVDDPDLDLFFDPTEASEDGMLC